MRRAVILSAALLSALAFAACSEDETTPPVSTTGGTASAAGGAGTAKSGGTTSNAGTTASGGTTAGDTGGTTAGDTGGTTAGDTGGTSAAGGATQIGATDPAKSIAGVFPSGGSPYWTSGTNKGYCYTYKDSAATVNPPCGDAGPCFDATSGICVAGTIVAAGATYANWGGGVGCGMNQDTAGVSGTPVSVTAASTINFTVYGATVPGLQLQVSLKVEGGAPDAGSADNNGNFCKRVAIPAADASIAIPVTDLTQMCWSAGGPAFDPATMTVSAVQFQLVSTTADTAFDFCFSQISVT